MTPYDLTYETFYSLLSNKVRSSLTILGIVVGIASVILMVAIGQGTQSSIMSSINSAGANLLMVQPGGERQLGPRGGGDDPNAGATLTEEDLVAVSQLADVENVAPEVTSQQAIAANGASVSTRITGVTGSYPEVKAIETSLGAFLTDADVESIGKVAVIGPTTSINLFGEGADPVGQVILVNGIRFTVIGVTESKGGTGMGSSDAIAYIPITTVQRYLTGSDDLTLINVQASSSEVMDSVKSEIESTLMSLHQIADEDEADFTVQSQSDILETASTITGTLTALLASIAGISLLVGGIGIMNMMLTTVTERTREIGLRKAIGARRSDVTSQFLAEAIALCMIGGVVGILLGWGIAELITATGLLTTQVSWASAALAVAVCAGIGVVFGFYPARRAAKLNPIEALRYQ